jgi:hypothetical protein
MGAAELLQGHVALIGNSVEAMANNELMRIKVRNDDAPNHFQMEWHRIATAPFDHDLQLAVIGAGGVRSASFIWALVSRPAAQKKFVGPAARVLTQLKAGDAKYSLEP